MAVRPSCDLHILLRNFLGNGNLLCHTCYACWPSHQSVSYPWTTTCATMQTLLKHWHELKALHALQLQQPCMSFASHTMYEADSRKDTVAGYHDLSCCSQRKSRTSDAKAANCMRAVHRHLHAGSHLYAGSLARVSALQHTSQANLSGLENLMQWTNICQQVTGVQACRSLSVQAKAQPEG